MNRNNKCTYGGKFLVTDCRKALFAVKVILQVQNNLWNPL